MSTKILTANNTTIKSKNLNFDTIRQFSLLFVLAIMFIVLSIITDSFLTVSNLLNVLRQVSIIGITAVGMTLVIILGEIDLSVGSIIAFSGVMASSAFAATNSSILAVLVALGIGTGIGLLNGIITSKGKIVGFVTTLASMSIFRGIAFIYTGGNPIAATDTNFTLYGTGHFLGIPIPIIIMIVIFILGYFLTMHTRFGRYVYAVGGNIKASKWSGLNVDNIKIIVFTLSGLLAGLSGLILAARLGSGQPFAGQGFELDVIAAVILGGTSLIGGKGRISGTLIGVLILGILSNGLTLLNVSSYWQQVVKGIIIVIAVLVDTKTRKEAK